MEAGDGRRNFQESGQSTYQDKSTKNRQRAICRWNDYRCLHPAQQHGRRFPSISSVRTRSICRSLVSGFLTEITQQIHSLRARGVMFSHLASVAGSEAKVFRKSAGSLCVTLLEISFLVILYRAAVRCAFSRTF